LFDGSTYNVLTANLTVNEIIEAIKRHIRPVNIQWVDAEIMNQLSYEVLNRRFIDMGFEFRGSIEKEVEETVTLLRSARSPNVR